MVLVGDIRIFVTIEWGCSISGGLLEVLGLLEHQLSGNCSNHGNTGWLLSTSPHPPDTPGLGASGVWISLTSLKMAPGMGTMATWPKTPLRPQNMHLSICKDQNVLFCPVVGDASMIFVGEWWMMFFELTHFNVCWWNMAMTQNPSNKMAYEQKMPTRGGSTFRTHGVWSKCPRTVQKPCPKEGALYRICTSRWGNIIYVIPQREVQIL